MMSLRPVVEGLPRYVEQQSGLELPEMVSYVPGKFHPVSVIKWVPERG